MITRKFTLIEILVVVTLMMLLMTLIFPALWSARESAHKAQSKTFAMHLKNAILEYESVYFILPYNGVSDIKLGLAESDDYDRMLELLTGRDGPDPGKDVCKTGRNQFILKEISDGYTSYGYCDFWHNRYGVVMDSNGDNQITLGGNVYHSKVVVYSFGKDGVDDNGAGDDLVEF